MKKFLFQHLQDCSAFALHVTIVRLRPLLLQTLLITARLKGKKILQHRMLS